MNSVEVLEGNGPVILGQPHGGIFLPPELSKRLNERGLALSDTDWHITRLYDGLLPAATVVQATFSRYVIDANRDPSGASLYPEIDLEVNGTLGEDVAGQDGTEERATALAVMRWNLYRGGADRARQREFIYRHALAKETRCLCPPDILTISKSLPSLRFKSGNKSLTI